VVEPLGPLASLPAPRLSPRVMLTNSGPVGVRRDARLGSPSVFSTLL